MQELLLQCNPMQGRLHQCSDFICSNQAIQCNNYCIALKYSLPSNQPTKRRNARTITPMQRNARTISSMQPNARTTTPSPMLLHVYCLLQLDTKYSPTNKQANTRTITPKHINAKRLLMISKKGLRIIARSRNLT